jgi:hypothetical protein
VLTTRPRCHPTFCAPLVVVVNWFRTAGPILILNWTSSSFSYTFNAPCRHGGPLIQTAWPDYGWRIHVRVDSVASRILGWQSVIVNGFRVKARNVTRNDHTILLVFKVTKNNSVGNGVCDIAVYEDIDVGGSRSHYIDHPTLSRSAITSLIITLSSQSLRNQNLINPFT